jgi:PA14 domain
MKKCLLLLLSIACAAGAVVARERDPLVVSSSSMTTEAPLIGTFYDMKQDQKHRPINMDRKGFDDLIARFIDGGWDEGLLKDYYRMPRPLYTTQLFVDTINSDDAPKAFGVEKTVQPRKWMVHYKGQIVPPSDGTYRFIGNADDFLGVAINGKTVLWAIHSTPRTKWFAKEQCDLRDYTAGDWIELKAGQPVDIDIMTGDSPGGQWRCLLAVEKKGVGSGGRPVPFQLSATKDTPQGAAPWKGVQ